MKLTQFLDNTNLENSLLIGYYGGGNYGDELLLEIMQNLLAERRVKGITIAYQKPAEFRKLHHDFGYRPIDIADKRALLRTTRASRTIVVGGGGLWGLDMNLNTFLMSVYLFAARYFLHKRVYLLGVGYYDSTTSLGHLGARLASWAAHGILARDKESQRNFKRYNPAVQLDTDIAFYASELDLSGYADDVRQLERLIGRPRQSLFIGLRRFQKKHRNRYNQCMSEYLAQAQPRPVILALLEAETVDPDSADQIALWRRKYRLKALDCPCNPLALFAYFQKHGPQLAVIAPQFHLLLTAHLTGTSFLPLTYDNKVTQLFQAVGIPRAQQIPIDRLHTDDIRQFAAKFYGG